MRIIALLLLITNITACNPVSKVLNNPHRFETVAKEVVRRGYCINDTTARDTTIRVITKDTLIHDTLLIPPLATSIQKAIDTTFISGARLYIGPDGKIDMYCPSKEIEHTVAINHYIRD